jgi:hypothetical protein
MNTLRRAFSVVALLPIYAIANAQELPKSGKYTSRYDWSFDGKIFQFEPDHFVFIGNLPGVNHNDQGKGFLHDTRVDCQIMWDQNKGKSVANGTCVATDATGEKAFAVWKCAGPVPNCEGDFQWTGGTGKYSGLTGGNKFTGVSIGQTGAGYSVWSGEWKLP